VSEMVRAARPGSPIGLYVWDASGGMELLARFWEAVRRIDPSSERMDEATRFRDICAPGPLAALAAGAGLDEIATRAIDVPTSFRDFDDLWTPFLGGQGPAPAYLASLTEARRGAVREALRSILPVKPDGSIHLHARAWAMRGRTPRRIVGRSADATA